MALPRHKVDQFTFEFWRGSPPSRITESVQRFERAGTEGSTFRTLAKRGEPFECELVSWFSTRLKARDEIRQYLGLIGADPVEVRREGEDLLAKDGVKFLVLDVREILCQTNALLLGPGKNYANGVEIVTRWTMAPVDAPTT